MRTRLLYLVSHPIQYQAPLLRKLHTEAGFSLRVLFERVDTTAGYLDPGFGTQVQWDVPLRDGFDNVALAETDLASEIATADVVWLHGWATATMRKALIIARKLGKPVLMRAENWTGAMPDGAGLRGWAKRMYLRWIFAHCRAFLAIGSANRAYYRRFGITDDRIFDVPYAVDNSYFGGRADASDRKNACNQLGIPADQPVILFSGKFQRRKHPDELLAAWLALPEPRPTLLMVGDGEMCSTLEATSPPEVKFTGFRNQSQLPELYALADVFVLPSTHEPWGLAVNEAMACGTAAIVSDQVGAAFDLVDESCGAVYPAGDIRALTAALVRVLADSSNRGEQAAAKVASWDFDADLRGLEQAVVYVHG